MFSFLYNTIVSRPLLNALIFFYQTIAFHDLGWAIVILTLAIRLLLFPLFHKSVRHQTVMQRIQPEVKKIQERHKGDRQKQMEATMALYREHNVNPLTGMALLLVQLPILFALYRIFIGVSRPGFALAGLYRFVAAPAALNTNFLGLIDLANRSILIVALASAAQFIQSKLAFSPVAAGGATKLNRQIAYFGTVFTFVIFYSLPAAVGLYWLVSSIFSIFQQIIINKKLHGLGSGNQKNIGSDGVPRFPRGG